MKSEGAGDGSTGNVDEQITEAKSHGTEPADDARKNNNPEC